MKIKGQSRKKTRAIMNKKNRAIMKNKEPLQINIAITDFRSRSVINGLGSCNVSHHCLVPLKTSSTIITDHELIAMSYIVYNKANMKIPID